MGNRLVLTTILTGVIGLFGISKLSAQAPDVPFYRDYGADQALEYLRRNDKGDLRNFSKHGYRINPDNMIQRTFIEFVYEYPRGIWVDNQAYKKGKRVIVPEGTYGSINLYPLGFREKTHVPKKGDKLRKVEMRINPDGTRSLIHILEKAQEKSKPKVTNYPDVSVSPYSKNNSTEF
jgi:hypothetical protein